MSDGSIVTMRHEVFYDTLHQELIMLSRAPGAPANVAMSDHKNCKWIECDCGIPDPQVTEELKIPYFDRSNSSK